ncbi:MAG: hypothetical protein IJY62_02160 [Clostridia bacterium]|nr:hypothetical protein [Clostridia bacterium]
MISAFGVLSEAVSVALGAGTGFTSSALVAGAGCATSALGAGAATVSLTADFCAAACAACAFARFFALELLTQSAMITIRIKRTHPPTIAVRIRFSEK